MTQQEGLEILVSAVKVANKRGAFELEESAAISEAIKLFIVPQEPKVENKQEEDNQEV